MAARTRVTPPLLPRRCAGFAPSAGLNNGHYVAYVRGGDGRWWRADDDEVEQVGPGGLRGRGGGGVVGGWGFCLQRWSGPSPRRPLTAQAPEAAVSGVTDAYIVAYRRDQPPALRRAEAQPPPPPSLAHWAAPDLAPPGPHSSGSGRQQLRPAFRLLPGRGAEVGRLAVQMAGVARWRDVKMATTRCAGGVRLRVYVAGAYCLDVALGLRPARVGEGGSRRRLEELLGGEEGAEKEGAQEGEVDVGSPIWSRRKGVLRVPLCVVERRTES